MKADHWLPLDGVGDGLRNLLEVVDVFVILLVMVASQCTPRVNTY